MVCDIDVFQQQIRPRWQIIRVVRLVLGQSGNYVLERGAKLNTMSQENHILPGARNWKAHSRSRVKAHYPSHGVVASKRRHHELLNVMIGKNEGAMFLHISHIPPSKHNSCAHRKLRFSCINFSGNSRTFSNITASNPDSLICLDLGRYHCATEMHTYNIELSLYFRNLQLRVTVRKHAEVFPSSPSISPQLVQS